ncbi:squalene/phytoene synthase family protein [bacterium]|nr:squalene/phytoene synthase family protein [bacterium]
MTSQELLKATSRAFYLSLRVLPPGARQTMSLAYLLARCADSVSDGLWLPADERQPALSELIACLGDRSQLDAWRHRVAAVDPARGGEAALLHHLPQALLELDRLPSPDQDLVVGIVTTLAQGMTVDLQRFPPGQLGSVWDAAELRRHLWAAAGCVGQFWTAVIRLHEPRLAQVSTRLEQLGTRLGNALQLTNVLRDISGDLADGRCYLPARQLLEIGLKPSDLEDPATEKQLEPVYRRWLEEACADFAASREYMLLIPWTCWRLRLAALWPWAMGVATLVKLAGGGWLRPGKIKVSRGWVYSMILTTTPTVVVTPWLRRTLERQLSHLQREVSQAGAQKVGQ